MPAALVIIDMQRGLLENETWGADLILERVGALERAARAAAVPIFYVVDQRVEPHPELHPRLSPQATDRRIAKAACDSFLGTGLQAQLEAGGIDSLIVCGLHTDFCIDTTCRRAVSLGYRVTLVEDAHSTFDRDYLSAAKVIEHHNRILSGFAAGDGAITLARAAAITFG
jgi:nicotinamidase-related amidase